MKKLNLSQWTSIAEIVGMGAVVISLVFVGIEIRQNTAIIQSESFSTSQNFIRSLSKLTATETSTKLIMNGLNDFDSLSPIEKAMFEGKLTETLLEFEISRKFYDQGLLVENEYLGHEVAMARILISPGAITWYAATKHSLPPELIDLLDQLKLDYADVQPMSEYFKFGAPPTKLQQTTGEAEQLTGLITFAFYKDVEAAEKFYVEIMGLKKSYHRPITRVFQVNDGAAIGLMDVSASPETTIDNKDMGFSFIVQNTSDVDRWYEYLKSHNVEIYSPPSDGTRTPVRSVHFYDPEGYDIEIFAWLPGAEMIKE